jgi:hypothetical protein
VRHNPQELVKWYQKLTSILFGTGKLDSVMSAGPPKHFVNPADSRRSRRVAMQIPILVRAQFEGDVPLKEDTHTLEVNAHGCLLALAMRVRSGQKLILKNWVTAIEQECRVVHVRENPPGKNEVGIAFPHPMPKLWNVASPPPDWAPYM